MKHRCLNERAANFPRYGGRGITICAAWVDSYERFVFDLGERPPGTTLDRIDVDGPYCASNCRWASFAQQRANQRPRPDEAQQARDAELLERAERLAYRERQNGGAA